MSHLYQRNGVWYLKYRNASGKWEAKSLRTRDRRQADQIKAAIDAEQYRLRIEKDVAPPPISVAGLCKQYLEYANAYYRTSMGHRTSEYDMIYAMAQNARRTCGETILQDLAPRHIRRLQEEIIQTGVARTTVNRYVGIFRRMIRWAVSQELVSPQVLHAIETVQPLKRGRSTAPERKPVEAVPIDVVEATAKVCSQVIQAMIWLQVYTGARPGEIVQLRPRDIDTTSNVWVARLHAHKTAYRGKERTLYFGPKAQAILRPFMLRPDDAYLFTRGRTESKYRVQRYRVIIQEACEKAGVPRWSPNQLRHTAATLIRKEYGLDAAQVWLGHATADVTQIYAEVDERKAIEIAERMG